MPNIGPTSSRSWWCIQQAYKPGGSHLITDQLALAREKMSLAPRSSLRSLVLLMSHGKPRLSSFFSSYSAAGAVTPGTATPVAPAVQPPAAPGLPDCSSHQSPDHQDHPLPGGPCGADDKPSLYAGSEEPKYPIRDDGSCSTLEPASGYVLPHRLPNTEGVGDPIPDPPPPGKKGNAVIDKTSPSTQENPEHPIPDGVINPIHDPPAPPHHPSPHLPPEGPIDPIHDPPPPPPKTGRQHHLHLKRAGSTPDPVPGPDKPLPTKTNNVEIVLDSLPDPARRTSPI